MHVHVQGESLTEEPIAGTDVTAWLHEAHTLLLFSVVLPFPMATWSDFRRRTPDKISLPYLALCCTISVPRSRYASDNLIRNTD